jgi:putative ABC transport system permease protein
MFWPRISTMWPDLRHALRLIRKGPAPTAVAVLTLAIGVGANVAIFSIIRAVLLKPPPYADSERLVRLAETWPNRTGPRPVSKQNYLDWAAQSTAFERIVAVSWGAATVSGGPVPVYVEGSRISPTFFDLFGLRAAIGRTFVAGEDQPGHDHVVVLSHHFWTAHLGADPHIVGTSLRLDGEPYTVVGVMPFGIQLTFWEADVWRPLSFEPLPLRSTHDLQWAVAKLKPGVSVAAARTQMDLIADRLARAYPDANRGYGVLVERYPRPVGLDVEASLYLLFAAVGAVLLIGCVNLANLALARTAARAREIAIRAALGAGRLRLVRQLLTEHLVIAAAGGVLGLIVGVSVLQVMKPFIPTTGLRAAFPPETVIGVDAPIWLFAFGLSLVSGILFGLAPALSATRLPVTEAIKREGSASVTGGRVSRRLRQLLIIADFALAFVLLTSAALLIQSFLTLTRRIEAGYDSTNVVTAALPIPDTRFPSGTALNAYLDQLAARVQSVPGIREVAFADAVPPGGFPYGKLFQIAGQPAAAFGSRPLCGFKVVSPSYFRAVRLRLIEGRTLEESDRDGAPLAVVINETMARTYFATTNPIGQRLLIRRFPIRGSDSSPDLEWTIVGLVADEGVSPFDQRTAEPALYATREQHPRLNLDLVVRTMEPAALMQESIRKAVASFDPDQAVTDLNTLDQRNSDDMAPDRLRSVLFNAFAVVALVLAAIGLYGVIAFSVVQRTREIGIRAALGASAPRLIALVFYEAASVIAIGIGIGVVGALVLTRLVTTFLFGVTPSDPRTLAGVAALLAGVGVLACYVPARRAVAVDPLVAVKSE